MFQGRGRISNFEIDVSGNAAIRTKIRLELPTLSIQQVQVLEAAMYLGQVHIVIAPPLSVETQEAINRLIAAPSTQVNLAPGSAIDVQNTAPPPCMCESPSIHDANCAWLAWERQRKAKE